MTCSVGYVAETHMLAKVVHIFFGGGGVVPGRCLRFGGLGVPVCDRRN